MKKLTVLCVRRGCGFGDWVFRRHDTNEEVEIWDDREFQLGRLYHIDHDGSDSDSLLCFWETLVLLEVLRPPSCS